MSEHNEHGSCSCEEPPEQDEQPLDLDEIQQRIERLRFLAPPQGLVATSATLSGAEDLTDLRELIGSDVPHLLSRLRTAEKELEDWRGRTHRYEYTTTEGDAAPTWSPTWSGHRHLREQPGYTPWVRTVSTSNWRRHEAPPF